MFHCCALETVLLSAQTYDAAALMLCPRHVGSSRGARPCSRAEDLPLDTEGVAAVPEERTTGGNRAAPAHRMGVPCPKRRRRCPRESRRGHGEGPGAAWGMTSELGRTEPPRTDSYGAGKDGRLHRQRVCVPGLIPRIQAYSLLSTAPQGTYYLFKFRRRGR